MNHLLIYSFRWKFLYRFTDFGGWSHLLKLLDLLSFSHHIDIVVNLFERTWLKQNVWIYRSLQLWLMIVRHTNQNWALWKMYPTPMTPTTVMQSITLEIYFSIRFSFDTQKKMQLVPTPTQLEQQPVLGTAWSQWDLNMQPNRRMNTV